MSAARAGEMEFQLLVDCCRWNFAANSDVQPLDVHDVAWNRFVHSSRFHRIQGLIWAALSAARYDVPAQVSATLAADARAIAASNLIMARECASLAAAFRAADVSLLFVKGLTLSALTYRSPMAKMGWDIDVLIDPADVSRAAEQLTDRGFDPVLPRERTHLHAWHSMAKESVWKRQDGIHVELHTRLADNEALIPILGVHSPSQTVTVAPGIDLPTLADHELFAYLCVHGASSAWFRLKWISDLAGFLWGRPAEEIERLFIRSQELGAGRAAGQALLLAKRLFELPLPPLTFDRATYRLAEAAMRQLNEHREPTEQLFGTWRIHWTQLLLLPDIEFKLAEMKRQVVSAIRRR